MKNVGPIDRVIRVLLGLGILAYFLFFGTWTNWALLALIPLGTGLTGFCPLYAALRIDTRGLKPVP